MKKVANKIVTIVVMLTMVLGIGYSMPATVNAYDNEYVTSAVAVVAFYVYNPTLQVTNDGRNFQVWASTRQEVERQLGVKYDDENGFNLSHGSGFFVGKENENPEYIVTNYHVVSDYVESNMGGKGGYYLGASSDGYDVYLVYEKCEMRVYYDSTNYDAVEVVDYKYDRTSEDGIDLAVCKLDRPTDKRHSLKLLEPTDSLKGKSVYAIGYPGITEGRFTSASKWGREDVTVTIGTISRIGAGESGVVRLVTDAKINHGNSGGPLVMSNGCVVGVNTNIWGKYDENGVWIDNDTRGYAISIRHVMDMLDANDIYYEVGEFDENEDKIVVEKETVKETVKETTVEKETVENDFDPAEYAKDFFEENGVYIIIGVSVVVVIIIVAIVLGTISKNKKKKKERAEIEEMIEHVAAEKQHPVIISMSSQHDGRPIPVANNTVLIGRDASCMIRYQEGTPGVSGRHAQVRYNKEANTFEITDLGSTYGTFFMDDFKLEPNMTYRLNAGESFYVGQKKNIIRVEMD